MKLSLFFISVIFLAQIRADNSGISYFHSLNSAAIGHITIAAITADQDGNIYIAGSTQGPNLNPTPRVAQPVYGGGTCSSGFVEPFNPPLMYPCDDAVIMKLDAQGNIAFATYLGGAGPDRATAIAVDRQGNVYVAGTSLMPPLPGARDFPTTAGAALPDRSRFTAGGFLTKLNSSGTAILYSTFIPTQSDPGIAVDQNGNAFFCGAASGAPGAFPATPGAFQTTASAAFSHPVVGELNASGSAFVYATYVSGSNNDSASDIAIDASGNAYITGSTTSSDFPATAGAFRKSKPGQRSGFAAKLNPSGSALVYSTYLGGALSDSGQKIRVDSQGNAYVLGRTGSLDFPISTAAFQSITPARWKSAADLAMPAFFAKLNGDGSNLIFSTYFTGAVAFDVDAAGNAFVAANVSRGFPTTAGALQRCMAGGPDDIVAARFTPGGNLAASTYLGGSFDDTAFGIAVEPDGAVNLTGLTFSRDILGIQDLPPGGGLFAARLAISDPGRQDKPCIALALQNGASFLESPVAAGELVTLFGLGIGPDQGAVSQPDPGGKIGVDLAGVRVFFGDTPAPLLYAQSEQINLQVPWELAGLTETAVHVEYQAASSNTATVRVIEADPGVFRLSATQAAVLNADGTVNSTRNPAQRGTVIAIFGTGGGPTNPAATTGSLAPFDPLAQIILPVSVQIGRRDAEVVYAGVAPGIISGVFQLNVRVPVDLPPLAAATVGVTIGGFSDPGLSTTIALQ